MNPKQAQFVREYLIDLNATQAAIRAGYSEKTAHSIGPRLLEHVGIAEQIKKAKAVRAVQTGVTAEWVIEKLEQNPNDRNR